MLDSSDGLSAVRCRVMAVPPFAVTVLGLRGQILPEPDSDDELLSTLLDGTVLKVRHARAIGGFASLSDWNGLGVNLAWRLWLSGGSVRACPDSVIAPPAQAEADPAAELDAAVASVCTCWDGRRLSSALAALRSQYGAQVDTLEGEWQPLRPATQKLRRRSDAELLRLFEQPKPHDQQLRDFGPSRRALIVTDDVLSSGMAGPAIRAWHMADELAGDHEVRLATTTGICDRSSDRFEVEAPSNERWADLEHWCELIIHQGYALTKVTALRGSNKIMVADAYDPVHLEVLELSKDKPEPFRSDATENAVAVLNDQLRRADFVLAASDKQRNLWLGQLASLGRINAANYDRDPTLRSLIDVVPFGLPSDIPRQTRSAIRGKVPGIAPDDRVIIWGGGLYNWFDPITLIKAIDILRQDVPTVRLFFMGGRHPNPLTPEMRTAVEALRLSDKLGLTGTYVFFNEGWVKYEERHNFLLDAEIGVSLHLDHVETEFSFRTRILDYIWAALPIVATEGDSFASIIEQHELGIVVPPEDPQATAAALRRILEDPTFAEDCRLAASELRSVFAWPQVMAPLVEFCRSPEHAADRIRPPGTAAPRDGLPSRVDRAKRLGRATARRYRRGGMASVAEGVSNTAKRLTLGTLRR
jgi:glycosyltransferase involved in cell wall biosynthesis